MKKLLLLSIIALLFACKKESHTAQPPHHVTGIELLSLSKEDQNKLIASQVALNKNARSQRRANPNRQHNKPLANLYNYDGQVNFPNDSATYYGNPWAWTTYSVNLPNDTLVIASFDYTDIYNQAWTSSRFMLFDLSSVQNATYLYAEHGKEDACNNECDIQPAVGSTVTVTFYPTAGLGGGEQLTFTFLPIQ